MVSITGETTRYNGLELDGVGAVAIAEGINYYFCSTCGSTMYHHNVMPHTGRRIYAVSLGAFTDEVFSAPTTEFFTKHRHSWVPAVPGAVQVSDPLGARVGSQRPTVSIRRVAGQVLPDFPLSAARMLHPPHHPFFTCS